MAWLVGPSPSGKCPPGNSSPLCTCQMTSTTWPGASYRPKKQMVTSSAGDNSAYTARSTSGTSSGRASARLTARSVASRAISRSERFI